MSIAELRSKQEPYVKYGMEERAPPFEDLRVNHVPSSAHFSEAAQWERINKT